LTLVTISWKALAMTVSGCCATKHLPASQLSRSLGSKGTRPRSGILRSSHIFAAPPVTGGKISLWQAQFGQTNPDMFSTTPIIGVSVFLQKFSSFLTSARATSCGVVTTTAPARLVFFRYYMMEICSSDVPGGVSMMR